MADYETRHLFEIKKTDCTPYAHKQYLTKLKKEGFEPKVIYDIGACVLHWTMFAKTLWPNAEFIAFDALPKAKAIYESENVRHYIGVLGNEDNKVVQFFQNYEHPTGSSYYREIGYENGKIFPDHTARSYVMKTLDTVVQENSFPPPDMIKIDVQGAEKDVIGGASNTLQSVQHLIVEMQHTEYNLNAPKVTETLPYIESCGFKCVAPRFCDNGPDADYGFVKM
jgi:FkbM family methyltransferase